MLIDPSAFGNIFNPRSVEITNVELGIKRGSSPDLFASILKQNSNEEIIKQQNYYGLNRFNLGVESQAYLMGGTNSPSASNFPYRYNIFEGAGGPFSQGFRPSAPPTTEELKNSFALEGIYQPFA